MEEENAHCVVVNYDNIAEASLVTGYSEEVLLEILKHAALNAFYPPKVPVLGSEKRAKCESCIGIGGAGAVVHCSKLPHYLGEHEGFYTDDFKGLVVKMTWGDFVNG